MLHPQIMGLLREGGPRGGGSLLFPTIKAFEEKRESSSPGADIQVPCQALGFYEVGPGSSYKWSYV